MNMSFSLTSTPSASPQPSPCYTTSQPTDPYARMSSRKAIACVTCAKAKTKCDKALPSCSRCFTKGIKCEPRSTRRTSDNSYRANIKKPLVSPKTYIATAVLSPRSIPTAIRPDVMRPASQIDFRTAVKMSQQAADFSDYQMLSPLSTYASQIVDECYSYASSPESRTDGFFQVEANGIPTSRRSTSQTPDIYGTPLSGCMSSVWSDDGMSSVGLGFNSDVEPMWGTPEPETMMPVVPMAWAYQPASVSPVQMSAGLASPIMESIENVKDYHSLAINQNGWSSFQPPINMSMVTSAPFMHTMMPIPVGHAPVWEDVFISGPAPY